MNEIALPTQEQARALTDRIKIAVEGTWQLIREAYTSRTWAVLGYETWDAYCTAEFGETRLRLPREERQDVVASLRESGLSTRAIASATGLSKGTVGRDLATAPVGAVAEIAGTNGKTYAASRPTADPHAWVEPGAEVVDAEVVDEPVHTYSPAPVPPQRAQSRTRVDVPRTVLVALSELRQVRDALEGLTPEQLARQDEETRRIWAARLSDDLEALHGFLDSLNKENNQ